MPILRNQNKIMLNKENKEVFVFGSSYLGLPYRLLVFVFVS